MEFPGADTAVRKGKAVEDTKGLKTIQKRNIGSEP